MEREEQKSNYICDKEFLIYYKKWPILWPVATVIGTIIAKFEPKLRPLNDLATILTVPVNSSDVKTKEDVQSVKNSTDLTVIWTDDDEGSIEVRGQSGRGFVLSKDSILKVRGDVFFVETDGQQKLVQWSYTRQLVVEKGLLQVIIDDKKVILNPKENCQFYMEEGSKSRPSPHRSSQVRPASKNNKTSPIVRQTQATDESIVSSGPPVPERLSQSRPPTKP